MPCDLTPPLKPPWHLGNMLGQPTVKPPEPSHLCSKAGPFSTWFSLQETVQASFDAPEDLIQAAASMSARAVAPYRTLDGLAVQTLQPPLPAPGEVRAGKLRRLGALQLAARTRSHGPLPMQPRRWQRKVAEPAPTQMNGAQHCCEPHWPCCLDCHTCTGPSQLGGGAPAPL